MSTDNKIKLIGTILGIILFIALVAGVTYAWVSWQSENRQISGISGCFPDIRYTNGTSLSTNNILLFDEDIIIKDNAILLKEGMAYLGATAAINDNCNTSVSLTFDLDVTTLNNAFITGNSIEAFKYVLASYDANTSDLSLLKGQYLNIVKRGSITNIGKTSVDGDILSTDVKNYLLIFYIDGDMAFNDAFNSTFSVNIAGRAVQVENSIID